MMIVDNYDVVHFTNSMYQSTEMSFQKESKSLVFFYFYPTRIFFGSTQGNLQN